MKSLGYWQVRPFIRPTRYPAVSGGKSVIKVCFGMLLVLLLQVVKRTNTPLLPQHIFFDMIYLPKLSLIRSGSTESTVTWFKTGLMVRFPFSCLQVSFVFVLAHFLILLCFPWYVFNTNGSLDYLIHRVLACVRFIAHVVLVDDIPWPNFLAVFSCIVCYLCLGLRPHSSPI